jgi:hypothetical protein
VHGYKLSISKFNQSGQHAGAPDELISPISIQFFEQRWGREKGAGVDFLALLWFGFQQVYKETFRFS